MFQRFLLCAVLGMLALVIATPARAAPEAHMLRIDPRATPASGNKLTITTVFEVIQPRTMSDVTIPCAPKTDLKDRWRCLSEGFERNDANGGALYVTVKGDVVDPARTELLVNTNGQPEAATFEDKVQWGKAGDQPHIGTAWLIALDQSKDMGDARYEEAGRVAEAFLNTLRPHDLVDLVAFDDKGAIFDSKWRSAKDLKVIHDYLDKNRKVVANHGSGRPLFDEIKAVARDGFSQLGNFSDGSKQNIDQIPLHQAMVVLSNGKGRNDPGSLSLSAEAFRQYLAKGRFPEDKPILGKTPLPLISIWFPDASEDIASKAYQTNDAEFMQNLANPEIGGFFDIVQPGEGEKAARIVSVVRKRFDQMWIVHWSVSCLDPKTTQSFTLAFQNTSPTVLPDDSFRDVPIAFNPPDWPLYIDVATTKQQAEANPPIPGGTLTVFGRFCWGTDTSRAKALFIPVGTKPGAPVTTVEQAEHLEARLTAQHMNATATQVGNTSVTFTVPDVEGVVDAAGDPPIMRLFVYDPVAKRGSGMDEKSVLTVRAAKKPFFTMPIIAAIVGGLVVLLLLIIVVMLGGSGKKRRGGTPPPAPYGGGPPPGAGYGAPPYGANPGGPYGMAPAPVGGGMGGAPMPFEQTGGMPPQSAYAQQGPPMGMPQPGYGPGPAAMSGAGPAAMPMDGSGTPSAMQVRCPSCGGMTMATPGQANVCFSCGQPLPQNVAQLAGGGGGGNAPAFPLTGALQAAQLQPPPNPYAGAGTAQLGGGGGATLSGAVGQFSIRQGADVRVGRDPAQCPIFLSEPRVSGVHSTLKFEAGQLWVRDETSNNGTYVLGARIPAGQWTPVPPGASTLRFGPVEFNVQLEP